MVEELLGQLRGVVKILKKWGKGQNLAEQHK